MAQSDVLSNANSLGDLVPVPHPSNGKSNLALQSSCSQLVHLLDNLTSKTAANAYKHWRKFSENDDVDPGPLCAPGHVCVVQLANKAVGVLKVARDGGCTFFVRLDRAHASQVADRDKHPRDLPRAYCRKLSISEAYGVLRSARPYCLKDDEVHHPHALSLLCSMTRQGWLKMGAADLPKAVCSCTLVVLTPLTRNFEQCLVLMGWKAAYMPADEALWTAQAVDRSVWGEMHDDFFVGDVVSKFADAARELTAYPAVFTELVPQVNSNDQAAAEALGLVQDFLHRSDGFATGQPALVPAPARASTPASAASAEQSSEVDMAPSDEDEEQPPSPPAPAPAPAPPAAEASVPPNGARPAPSSSRSRARRPPRDDESDGNDQDEKAVAEQDAELARVDSTDSESESDSGASAGGYSDNDGESSSTTSDDGSGDDDDDDEDDEEEEVEGSDSDSDSQPLADKPIAKNSEHTPTARTTAAAIPGPQRLPEAQWLVEFARPCCKHIELFQREHRALIAPERMALIDADLQALRKPDSVPALLGAALSLVSNVVGVHRDAPPADAVPLGAVGRKRVRELAVQATDFSELTLSRVDRAVEAARKTIEELEDLRKRGRTVLESVESACASTGDGPTEAPAEAEAPQQP